MTYRPDNPFAPKDPKTDPVINPDTAALDYAMKARAEAADLIPDVTATVPFYGLVEFTTGTVFPMVYEEVGGIFSGVGTPNTGHAARYYRQGYYPPTDPAWMAVVEAGEAAETATANLQAARPEYDPEDPLWVRWLETHHRLKDAMEAAKKAGARAHEWKADDGFGWVHHVQKHQAADDARHVAQNDARWKMSQTVTARPLPTMDDAAPEWVVDGLLPAGGLALVVGAADAGKSTLMAHLAYGVATDEGFLGQTVMPDEVVVIDTDTAPTVLADRYASALAYGVRVVPFRGRAADLDVRDATIRSWLARSIPAGALVIVDSLATPMALLDVSETTAEAGGYLTAWATLAAEAKAAGIIVVHASPASDPTRPRGHGSLAAVTDALWVVKESRGKRTLEADTGVTLEIHQTDAASDPAKPGEEEGAAGARPVKVSASASLTPGKLLDAVKEEPGRTTTQVAEAAGIPLATADRHLKKMEADGILETSKGSRGKSTFWFVTASELRKG